MNSKDQDKSLVENKSVLNKKEEKDSKRDSVTNSLKETVEGKENVNSKDDTDNEVGENASALDSPKIPRKFIKNWRQACDRTKDRTKELLKRWRTLPESETIEPEMEEETSKSKNKQSHGWSVHVWSTWVTRGSLDEDDDDSVELISCLSPQQSGKFSHFFTHLLDWDRDDLISAQDFESLSERLRHFADWSTNSVEFHILQEVEQGFIESFITSVPRDPMCSNIMAGTTSIEQWLMQWSKLITNARHLVDFPVWLQYFSKIIFLVINKSGSNVISRDELRVFYSSFLGFDTQKVGETLDTAFNSMTSNGDHPLRFPVFNLCFANFLLGRNLHGPGQFLFGPYEGSTLYSTLFPIDFSALNSKPDSLEQYSPHKKSNRHSVVV